MSNILSIYFHVKNKLENSRELCRFMYHGWRHTKSFYDAVCYLGRLENIDDYNFDILKKAALFHDTGYTVGNTENHEYQSTIITRQELPPFDVGECEISDINRLIMSTVPGHRPNGILEEIMIDADFEYLGRDYYPYVSELLRTEKNISYSTWKKEQISFLKKHKFITISAQNLFDHQKYLNYEMLLKE